ncbi:MAG: DNA-formamidopyrimidine glycosylase [Chloroflexi bacterium RBG_13_54_9]|nr:MAG: DNA-formamidopyrimidine glycosylase [Chloroflexi bacterium RBG_13_54_9]
MPELPEVETIKNYLLPRVVGRCFTGVTLLWPRAVRYPSPEEFRSRLIRQTIKDISRRGKYLLFRLDRDTLILHLRMTGVLLLQPSSAGLDPHIRTVFHLDNETSIYFRDQRKFGAIWLVEDETEVVGKLGPEPLTPAFTPEALGNIICQHNIPVKALLCDQNLIAGIGNMYADEALFAARIDPLKKARELSPQETERLHRAICKVLTNAIEHGGASVDTYQHPDGGLGSAQSFFQVAHCRGEQCPVCGAMIERIPIRGRGTYFCPRCQGT